MLDVYGESKINNYNKVNLRQSYCILVGQRYISVGQCHFLILKKNITRYISTSILMSIYKAFIVNFVELTYPNKALSNLWEMTEI